MLGVWLSILLAIGFIGVYAWQIAEEGAAARRRARRDRAGAGARAASVAARRSCRRRRARARHAARDHRGGRQGAGARDRSEIRPTPRTCGCCASRRSAAARSWRSSPSCRPSGEPFDAHAAVRADRGGGGAASQFRHRDRCGAAVRARTRAGRRAQSGDPLRPRQPGRERGRFRPRARRGHGATGTSEDVAVTISDDGPGFAPEIIGPDRRALCAPAGAAACTQTAKTTGLGLGFFIAKTLLERSGATLTFEQPRAPGQRRRGQRALGRASDFERRGRRLGADRAS